TQRRTRALFLPSPRWGEGEGVRGGIRLQPPHPLPLFPEGRGGKEAPGGRTMSEKRTRYRIALYALAACGLLGGGALVGRGLPAGWAPPTPPGHIVYLGDPEHPAFAPALLDEEPPARPARDGIANVSSRTSRLVRATGFPGMGKLFVAAPPPPPTVQESLQKMQKSIERLERLAPATEAEVRAQR